MGRFWQAIASVNFPASVKADTVNALRPVGNQPGNYRDQNGRAAYR
ncbi:hypothetical protein [Nostoc sp.]